MKKLLILGVAAATVLSACTTTAPPGTGRSPASAPYGPAGKMGVAGSSGCPTPRPKVISTAPGSGKTVALTFDDGPGLDTLQIASTLKAHGVNRATFFDIGQHDARYPSVVRQVAAMGYLVGDHTWNHAYPRQVRGGWAVPYLRDQIGRTAREQESLTGERTCYFRPPGGFLTNVLTAAHQLGMSVVLWNVDSQDWQQPSHPDPAFVARIVRKATTLTLNPTHPIVLMHAARASHGPLAVASPYRSNTIAALPDVIAWYRARGYTFVDLSGRS